MSGMDNPPVPADYQVGDGLGVLREVSLWVFENIREHNRQNPFGG